MCMWIHSLEKTNMQNEIYFGRDLISEQDLRHYGMPKRSGRYPWGSGDDPYHHGADGPGGKKSSKSDGPKESYFKRRAAKKAAVAKAKQERIDREAKEERERQKQEALKTGDPKKLAPFIRDLSDAELRQASDRLRLENEFANRLSEASKYQKTAADKIQAKLNKLNSYTSTGIDTWNNYAKIANVFRDAEDQLPIIGEKKKKNKDKGDSNNSGDQNNSNKGSKPAKSEKPEKPENPTKPTESTKSEPQSKPETSSKKSEEELVNQWREEANKIVEEAGREKAAEDRSDFRREMAEEFSNHLKEEAKQKEIDEWVDNVRNKVRKEFRRNQAEEFSNSLKEQEQAEREEKERELQEKWRREAEDIELNARRNRDDYEEYDEPTIDLTDYYPDYEIDYSTDTPNLTNTQWRNLVSANGKRLKKKR